LQRLKGILLARAPKEKSAAKEAPAAARGLDAFDVSALEHSLNDSAARVSTIWVSFLFFSLYLLSTAAAVTHRQLLLGESLKLPVLNVDLPVRGFTLLAPILFVMLHVYVLLQLVLLARTAEAYNAAVERAGLSPHENASLRQRLTNTMFAQIFAGSPREREGLLGWLLKAMAWTTLAIAPVLILLVFQLMFLAHHNHLATWTHRGLIVVELALLFVLRPLVLDARRDLEWAGTWIQLKRTAALPLRLFAPKGRRREEWVWLRRQAMPLASCVLFVLVSLLLATFPGEPHLNLLTGRPLFSVQCERWVFSRFDRLVLPLLDVVDDEKLGKIETATAKRGLHPALGERTQDFSGRDLNCAIFVGADLRRVDFSRARMTGADLSGADLQGASFGYAQLQGATLSNAQMQNANFTGAQLQGADLSSQPLFGTTELQGASFFVAQLQGADLRGARLQGAILRSARLHGADLGGAQLQGAELLIAELQGANLKGARLQGADIVGAKLQGANLSGAQLQGANLGESELKLALLSEVSVWRAKGADCSDARTTNPKYDAAVDMRPRPDQADEPVSATPEAIADFIDRAVANVGGPRKDEVREQLRAGLVGDIKKEELDAIETNWRTCAANSETIERAVYDRQHADFLRDLACDATTSRKEVAAGIIRASYSPDADRRAFFTRLARGLLGLDGKACAATGDLSESDREGLRKFLSQPGPAD
jgi:uncharacterized protein YjbI with pentapeptide repeats